jgi:hypothetical protein
MAENASFREGAIRSLSVVINNDHCKPKGYGGDKECGFLDHR